MLPADPRVLLWLTHDAFKDDTLPSRLLEDPMPLGPAKGSIVELDRLLRDYYRTREWDERGVPTPEKLARLGLSAEGETFK